MCVSSEQAEVQQCKGKMWAVASAKATKRALALTMVALYAGVEVLQIRKANKASPQQLRPSHGYFCCIQDQHRGAILHQHRQVCTERQAASLRHVHNLLTSQASLEGLQSATFTDLVV